MGFESSKLGAGVLLYATFVVLPTVELLMLEQELDNPILQRLIVGVLGMFAGHMAWKGLLGPESQPGNATPRYPGLNPPFLLGGLAVLYLAWFSNLPSFLAGQFDGTVLVVSQDKIVSLDAMWPRIVTSVFTMLGGWLFVRGFTVMDSPMDRKAKRIARREQRRNERREYHNQAEAWE